jgi:hypothetical protein
MDKKIRTLSEEFYSLSPKSQSILKCVIVNSPTSKYKKEYTNLDKYNESGPEERKFMEQYGLVLMPFRSKNTDMSNVPRLASLKSNLTKKLENK